MSARPPKSPALAAGVGRPFDIGQELIELILVRPIRPRDRTVETIRRILRVAREALSHVTSNVHIAALQPFTIKQLPRIRQLAARIERTTKTTTFRTIIAALGTRSGGRGASSGRGGWCRILLGRGRSRVAGGHGLVARRTRICARLPNGERRLSHTRAWAVEIADQHDILGWRSLVADDDDVVRAVANTRRIRDRNSVVGHQGARRQPGSGNS